MQPPTSFLVSRVGLAAATASSLVSEKPLTPTCSFSLPHPEWHVPKQQEFSQSTHVLHEFAENSLLGTAGLS